MPHFYKEVILCTLISKPSSPTAPPPLIIPQEGDPPSFLCPTGKKSPKPIDKSSQICYNVPITRKETPMKRTFFKKLLCVFSR